MRIAFFGASGTGKTTLAKAVSVALGIPLNPIGSRSVAQSMGFEKPYDVDPAGKRVEFQIELSNAKLKWESFRSRFVTDRTGADEWAYASIHAPELTRHDPDVGIRYRALAYGNKLVRITSQYDLIFHTPVDVFQDIGNDPARRTDFEYHLRTEALMLQFMGRFNLRYEILDTPHLQERLDVVLDRAARLELEHVEEIWHES